MMNQELGNKALIATNDGQIGYLDLDSGEYTALADTPVFTDIAISDIDRLYGITSNELYRIDTQDGSSTLVGSLEGEGFNALGFARGFVTNNAFYATSGSGFYEIDTETGAASLVADLGADFNSGGDLVFDIASNSFWAISRGEDSDALFTISLDGETTKISDLDGYSEVYGLSFDRENNLIGYTSDGQQLYINRNTGTIDFVQNIEGINGEIFGATEAPQLDNSYLERLNVSGTITGGNTGGGLLDTVIDPEVRNVGFQEIQTPQGEGGQTWVIVHGWNSSPDAPNIADLTSATIEAAKPSDRILVLDWREAANNRGTVPGSLIHPIAGGGNGIAATWISATAQFAAEALITEYGIDPTTASQNLNFVGHSLGSLVSAEVGQIYKTGTNRAGEVITTANEQGVRTITALDPAAEINLRPDVIFKRESGYDVDGSIEDRQTPAKFNDSAVFSRAYLGFRSIAGNPGFADVADEAYELDFNNLFDFGNEHGRVVQFFSNILQRPGMVGDALGLDSYRSLDNLPTDNFGEIDVNRRFRSRTYQGIINVNGEDLPTLLTANSAANPNDQIIIGEYLPDVIDGGIGNDRLYGQDDNDTITGKSGNDILVGGVGSDRLIGDGASNIGDDLIYGGTGRDILTGDGGTDTFVFQAGDGNSDRASSNLITDFEIGVDRIGLIDLESQTITLEGDTVDSAILQGGEYLAVLEGVSLNELTTASQDAAFYSTIDPTVFDLV